VTKSPIVVTIVIPTYKRSDKLARCLNSVLGQTYDMIEVLIANDNHTDDDSDKMTESVLAGFVARDPRIRVVHTDGGVGGGAARNLACSQAKGDYLAFLDDDDEYLPDKISSQLAFMQVNGLDMCWQDVSWYGEDGKLVEHRRLDHCKDFSREGLLRAHLLTPIAPTSIYMLKRSLFEQTEGFGEVATGQDWWLMLRCIEAGARIGYMPEVHVRQYLHSGERLSIGANKIAGEKLRHEKVRSYYPQLSKKDVAFIEFRHNAVLAFACGRGGRRADAVKYAVRTFLSSPRLCFEQGVRYFTSGKRLP